MTRSTKAKMLGMRIWKLTPTNLAYPIWKKWSPEPIIVRAEGDSEARQWAQLKALKTFPAVPGMALTLNPSAEHKKIEDPGPQPTL